MNDSSSDELRAGESAERCRPQPALRAAAFFNSLTQYGVYEIGLRHPRSRKNQTDGSQAVEHINYRYLPAFIYPITATLKLFLARKGHGVEEVEKMHQAWLKSVILRVTLWSQPYLKDGDF